jgi:hypothetical protein
MSSYRSEGTLYKVLQAQYRAKSGRPIADEIARAELLPFKHLPEHEAVPAFVEYTLFKELPTEANIALLEAAIRKGLRLLGADDLETLKAIEAKGLMFHWGKLLEASSDIKPIRLIQHIRWGIGKNEVRQMFSGKPELPVEAGWNEIGFYGPSYGLPAAFFFQFTKGMLGGDKLVRSQIVYFVLMDARPPDDDIERAFLMIRKDLVGEYGRPRELSNAKHDVPAEFRQSQVLVWKRSDSILTLSYGLLRDGVPPDINPPIAVGYGDRKRDPVSLPLDRY